MLKKYIKKIIDLLRDNTKRSPISEKIIKGLKLGINSDINGKIDIRVDGGEVIIGSDSLIEGMIATETKSSRVYIGNNVFIGGGSIIDAVTSINIEDDVLISYQCIIQDSDNHNLAYSLRKNDTADWKNRRYHNWELTPKKPVRISKGAWIGARAIILKGVTVGIGSVVGAGSVVTKDVADWTIVAGNPAKLIREIPENER